MGLEVCPMTLKEAHALVGKKLAKAVAVKEEQK